jgi:hypothetical protein
VHLELGDAAGDGVVPEDVVGAIAIEVAGALEGPVARGTTDAGPCGYAIVHLELVDSAAATPEGP